MKKRNRTSERSIEAIEYAVLEKLQTCSLPQIKVSDICAAAHISRPTFYAHFHSKEDVLAWHIAKQCLPIADALQNLPEQPSSNNTEVVIHTFFSTWQKLNLDFRIYQQNGLVGLIEEHYLTLQHQLYAKHKGLQEIVSETEADYFFSYYTGGLFALLKLWMSNEMSLPIETLTRLAVSMIQSGDSPR